MKTQFITIYDEYISFETAKLAKEKGFMLSASLNARYQYNLKDSKIFMYQQRTPKHSCEKCTQSLLQKWLREIHNIQMILKPFYDSLKKKNTFICDVIRVSDGKVIKSPRLDSYEKALEAGIHRALQLI